MTLAIAIIALLLSLIGQVQNIETLVKRYKQHRILKKNPVQLFI